jgi:hypothetical protein
MILLNPRSPRANWSTAALWRYPIEVFERPLEVLINFDLRSSYRVGNTWNIFFLFFVIVQIASLLNFGKYIIHFVTYIYRVLFYHFSFPEFFLSWDTSRVQS